MASVITDCGFNVVSLAGNHAMDWGPEPLLDTVELLRGKGIQTIGAGRNLAEARNLPSSNARVSGSQCSPIVPSCMKARLPSPTSPVLHRCAPRLVSRPSIISLGCRRA
jgi:hypothetical protein